jgi:Protein of unknown function (DUF1570)
VVLAAGLAGQAPGFPDLGFTDPRLTGWQGQGFALLASPARTGGPEGVWSDDSVNKGRKALLHRGLILPANAGVISFRAAAVRAPGAAADDRLSVVLLAAGGRIIPREVKTASGWQQTATLPSGKIADAPEYLWRVADYAGQGVRIVLFDEDDRPGCYLWCSGFRLIAQDEFESRDFVTFMTELTRKQHLVPVTRYDSPHFLALSNADEEFSEQRIRECELMYRLFYDHFRHKGFTLHEPAARLMLAMFNNQQGFEAYLGSKRSPFLTGLYHPDTNRFVLYDFGQNEAYRASMERAEKMSQGIPLQMNRLQYLDTVKLHAGQMRANTNIATVMHEAAHQLSFNCGLLNRRSDLPMWLCEGLACYCEATSNGAWQGPGQPNPDRLVSLAEAAQSQERFLDIKELVESDRWLRQPKDQRSVLLGYAQSWALFRLLMEERPEQLKKLFAQIYSRQASERRMADFEQCFGSLTVLQHRYADYLNQLAQQVPPRAR